MNKIKDALHNLQMTKTDKIYYIISWIMIMFEFSWSFYFFVIAIDSTFLDLFTYYPTFICVIIYPIFYLAINYILIKKNMIKKWSLALLFILRIVYPGTLHFLYWSIFSLCVKYF